MQEAKAPVKRRKKTGIVLLVLAILLVGGVFALNRGYDYFMRMSYPTEFAEIVSAEAEKNDLDPALVFAVIRTESRFEPDARSHADAYGLMQITPNTFTWLQTWLKGDRDYKTEDLYDPQINIRYGSKLLRILLDQFESWETALCAYNAGIGTVNSWLSDSEVSSDGKTIPDIPYPETKNYVRNVMKDYQKYKELYGSALTGGKQ